MSSVCYTQSGSAPNPGTTGTIAMRALSGLVQAVEVITRIFLGEKEVSYLARSGVVNRPRPGSDLTIIHRGSYLVIKDRLLGSGPRPPPVGRGT